MHMAHSLTPTTPYQMTRQYLLTPHWCNRTRIHEHRRQRKIARRQHIKQTLRLLSESENLFLDNNITQAEDERTILAKDNQTNTQRRVIDSAYVKNNKPAIGLAQRGRNTAYSLGMTIRQSAKHSRKSATPSTSDLPRTTKYIFLTKQKHQS